MEGATELEARELSSHLTLSLFTFKVLQNPDLQLENHFRINDVPSPRILREKKLSTPRIALRRGEATKLTLGTSVCLAWCLETLEKYCNFIDAMPIN